MANNYFFIDGSALTSQIRIIQRYCGHKLKRSAPFLEWVSTVPPEFRDRFSKSEKGVDIELCCDALKLASASRMDRLFLMTNDDDFLPLCRTLKEFGANVSLIHLHNLVSPNLSLVAETDTYDVVPIENLHAIFTPPVISDETGNAETDTATAPATEPKSLNPPPAQPDDDTSS